MKNARYSNIKWMLTLTPKTMGSNGMVNDLWFRKTVCKGF